MARFGLPSDGPVAAAVLVTVLAWASAFVAIRGVHVSFSAGSLALGRLATGTVVLSGVLVARRRWVRPTWGEWRLLILCGVCWFGIYNVVLNASEQHLDAGTTAMLVGIGPILIALLAGVILDEGYPRRLLVGIAVAFVGVLLIGTATRRSEADLAGVVFAVLAAVAYGVGVVSQKPLLRRLPPLQVVAIACGIGTACCLPWTADLVDDAGRASMSAVAAMLYLGAVPTALAFTTWGYALARTNAGKLGATTYVVPPMVVLLGWLLLDEAPTGLAVAGGIVCLSGVALSRRGPRVPTLAAAAVAAVEVPASRDPLEPQQRAGTNVVVHPTLRQPPARVDVRHSPHA